EAGKKGALWTELGVERAVAFSPRPPGDPTQDELWLASGDQLFGKVVRADRKEVALEGRFGTRSFPWSALRGWFRRRTAAPPAARNGGGCARGTGFAAHWLLVVALSRSRCKERCPWLDSLESPPWRCPRSWPAPWRCRRPPPTTARRPNRCRSSAPRPFSI